MAASLRYLAQQNPEWSFVLVGATSPHAEIGGDNSGAVASSNVHFLEPKSTPEISAYPQHFDVCIMPYQNDDYTKFIYPLKLHEYLATGRPTVGTPIQSLHEFADVVALPMSPRSMVGSNQGGLRPEANTEETRIRRQAVARRYDWELIVLRIAKAIAEAIGKEVFRSAREGPGSNGETKASLASHSSRPLSLCAICSGRREDPHLINANRLKIPS